MEAGSAQRRSQNSPVISPGHRQSFEGPPPIPTRRGLMTLSVCECIPNEHYLFK